MSKVLMVHEDGLTWANPWSRHTIIAPDRDGRMQSWISPMHWFHAQSVSKIDGTDLVIEKIRRVREDRPEQGDPDDKKNYRPMRPWKLLVTDHTKAKIDCTVPCKGGMRRDKTHVIRSDWGQIWPQKLLMSMAYKFDQHEKLKKLLLDTGDAQILYDVSDETFGATDLNGVMTGGNEVGKVLVQIRDQLALRAESGDDTPLVKRPKRRNLHREAVERYDVVLDSLSDGVKAEDCSEELQDEIAKFLELEEKDS